MQAQAAARQDDNRVAWAVVGGGRPRYRPDEGQKPGDREQDERHAKPGQDRASARVSSPSALLYPRHHMFRASARITVHRAVSMAP